MDYKGEIAVVRTQLIDAAVIALQKQRADQSMLLVVALVF
jgi:hypothetical protein